MSARVRAHLPRDRAGSRCVAASPAGPIGVGDRATETAYGFHRSTAPVTSRSGLVLAK